MHIDRLMILYDHMKYGDRGHKKFDFAIITDSDKSYSCGTAGCMMGELPIIWPEYFYFDKVDKYAQVSALPIVRKTTSIADFFGLTSNQFYTAFYPDTHCLYNPGYKAMCLSETSTLDEVLANLRRLIESDLN